MKKVNVYGLPLACNVCDQMLREVEKILHWTMAHIIMNPKAYALLHEHYTTEEAYIITRGSGHLVIEKKIYSVQVGDVVQIPVHTPHMLKNTGAGSLEHLVLASPPFHPKDVHLLEEARLPITTPVPFNQPEVSDCFDGAKIISYDCGDDLSIAFGWVSSERNRHKPAHCHHKTTEWIFVVEGYGYLKLNGKTHPINHGDWIQVEPGEFHALRNEKDQHMVVVCICCPSFDMADVYFS